MEEKRMLDYIRLAHLTSTSTLIRRFGEDKIYEITIVLGCSTLVLTRNNKPDINTVCDIFDNQIHPDDINIYLDTIKFASNSKVILRNVENNLAKIHNMAKFALDNLKFTKDIDIIITLIPEDKCK